jgi:hypothetical protein
VKKWNQVWKSENCHWQSLKIISEWSENIENNSFLRAYRLSLLQKSLRVFDRLYRQSIYNALKKIQCVLGRVDRVISIFVKQKSVTGFFELHRYFSLNSNLKTLSSAHVIVDLFQGWWTESLYINLSSSGSLSSTSSTERKVFFCPSWGCLTSFFNQIIEVITLRIEKWGFEWDIWQNKNDIHDTGESRRSNYSMHSEKWLVVMFRRDERVLIWQKNLEIGNEWIFLNWLFKDKITLLNLANFEIFQLNNVNITNDFIIWSIIQSQKFTKTMIRFFKYFVFRFSKDLILFTFIPIQLKIVIVFFHSWFHNSLHLNLRIWRIWKTPKLYC